MSSSSTSSKRKKPATSSPSVFFGEEHCARCTNPAYYYSADDNVLLCGTHSRKLKETRVELPKNPHAKEHTAAKYRSWQLLVDEAAFNNFDAGRKGTVRVSKLRMMRAPEHIDGVLNVFPNNKHQNRVDGYGCASLSPMRLGPVQHGQPGVPDSLTIENYHQFNKVFEREVDRAADGTVTVKPEFFERRDAAYRSRDAQRHKFNDERGVGGNRNIPLFSLHVAPNGELRRYSYLESRYFYCHQYELLAKQTPDFAHLRALIRTGHDLQIVGYDGYEVTQAPDEHYNDVERPFGHEMVLYCLLTIDNVEEYPWNRFYRKNKALYD